MIIPDCVETLNRDSSTYNGILAEQDGFCNDLECELDAALNVNGEKQLDECSSGETQFTQLTVGTRDDASIPSRDDYNYGVNQFGGLFRMGRPLPMNTREMIKKMHLEGCTMSTIAKTIKASQACVSRIIKRFKNTGSIHPKKIGGSAPKVTIEKVVEAIIKIKQNRSIRTFEIQKCLISENICAPLNVPSISTINRSLHLNIICRILRKNLITSNGKSISQNNCQSSEASNSHSSEAKSLDFTVQIKQETVPGGANHNLTEDVNNTQQNCISCRQRDLNLPSEGYAHFPFYDFVKLPFCLPNPWMPFSLHNISPLEYNHYTRYYFVLLLAHGIHNQFIYDPAYYSQFIEAIPQYFGYPESNNDDMQNIKY